MKLNIESYQDKIYVRFDLQLLDINRTYKQFNKLIIYKT